MSDDAEAMRYMFRLEAVPAPAPSQQPLCRMPDAALASYSKPTHDDSAAQAVAISPKLLYEFVDVEIVIDAQLVQP